MGELLARIRVFERKLRKEAGPKISDGIYLAITVTVDFEKGRVFLDGSEIHLDADRV